MTGLQNGPLPVIGVITPLITGRGPPCINPVLISFSLCHQCVCFLKLRALKDPKKKSIAISQIEINHFKINFMSP